MRTANQQSKAGNNRVQRPEGLTAQSRPRTGLIPTDGPNHELELIRGRKTNLAGFRIRIVRLERRITIQEFVALGSQFSPDTTFYLTGISRVENDCQALRVDVLFAFGKILGVSPDWLMGRSRLRTQYSSDHMILPRAMAYIRFRKKLTLKTASLGTAIRRHLIRQFEIGASIPTDMQLNRICDYYGYSVQRLLSLKIPRNFAVVYVPRPLIEFRTDPEHVLQPVATQKPQGLNQ
jgi:transcriptional regulator with XRE-family HTH domain